MNVVFPAGIGKLATLADGTLSITIQTAELNDETMARPFSLRKKPGVVLISSEGVTDEMEQAVSQITPSIGKQKSKSERLRAVMYRYWEEKGEGEFNDFYSRQMEALIDKYKELLG